MDKRQCAHQSADIFFEGRLGKFVIWEAGGDGDCFYHSAAFCCPGFPDGRRESAQKLRHDLMDWFAYNAEEIIRESPELVAVTGNQRLTTEMLRENK